MPMFGANLIDEEFPASKAKDAKDTKLFDTVATQCSAHKPADNSTDKYMGTFPGVGKTGGVGHGNSK